MISFREHITKSVDLHLSDWHEAYLFSKQHSSRVHAIEMLNGRLSSYQSVYKKGHATSLYVLSYFLDEGVITKKAVHSKEIEGLEKLQRHLFTKCDKNQVILCTLAADTKPHIVLHTFVLEVLTNNEIYIYQAIESHYNLKECLTKYDIKPLSKENVLKRLDKLINNSFISIKSKNFQKLFHVSLFDIIKKYPTLSKVSFTIFSHPFIYRKNAPQSIEYHDLNFREQCGYLNEAIPLAYKRTVKALIIALLFYSIVLKIRPALT